MWAFVSARLRQWIVFAVALPLITTAVHLIRVKLEAQSGPTRVTRAMGVVERFGQRQSRR